MRYLVCFWTLFLIFVTRVDANEPADSVNISLQTGDLLFCNSTSTGLSKAIDQATQTNGQTHFDHLGIVEISGDTIMVLHAAPKKGVCREPIGLFLLSGKEVVKATAYRLKNQYINAIPAAIQKAQKCLGKPYNYTYRLNDPGYYCSGFIYEIFAADSIFSLDPMTFKDRTTGHFLPGWVDHYQKLGIPVPEGEPGCNPNGLAASPKLEMIGSLKLIHIN